MPRELVCAKGIQSLERRQILLNLLLIAIKSHSKDESMTPFRANNEHGCFIKIVERDVQSGAMDGHAMCWG